jgi:Uncharacterized protein conserved in bacteria (DUF2334)
MDGLDMPASPATSTSAAAASWLPAGKRAAICFTIDDIHPGRTSDGYDGGGDLDSGALGLVRRLLEKHPLFRVTLFTTPDWREIGPVPTRKILARIPVVRDRVFLTKLRPRGAMRLDRHPEFVAYLKSLPRTEIGLHGLHHVHPGRTVLVEFQNQSVATCKRTLTKSMRLFDEAGLPFVRGMVPPGWNAPPALIEAMAELGLSFLASARDIKGPIARGAKNTMSGLLGVSLLEPERMARGRLVHIPANFQATSAPERAFQIIEAGGLLSIKAHIVKSAMGHTALDGVDTLYMNYLDALLTLLEDRYGDALWWTSMGEIAATMRGEQA